MTTTFSPSDKTARALEIAKSVYQTDQQDKLMSLHADAESLLQQLQALKQQRSTSAGIHNN